MQDCWYSRRISNFFVASAFRPVWPGRCDLSFICIPQSTRALDQGGVEPRQAVSPKALRPWTIPLRYSVGYTAEGLARVRASIHTFFAIFDDEEWRIITLFVNHLDSKTKYTDLFAASCGSIDDFTDIKLGG